MHTHESTFTRLHIREYDNLRNSVTTFNSDMYCSRYWNKLENDYGRFHVAYLTTVLDVTLITLA